MFPIGQSGKGFGNEQEGLVTIPQMATASSSNLPFGNFFESFWTPLVRFNMESEFDTTLRTHLRPQLNIFLKTSKKFFRPMYVFGNSLETGDLPRNPKNDNSSPKTSRNSPKFGEFSISLTGRSHCVPVSKNSWTPIDLWIYWNSHLPRFPGRRASFFAWIWRQNTLKSWIHPGIYEY